ncbi:unnamed protein product [Rhodiola kirilowii]
MAAASSRRSNGHFRFSGSSTFSNSYASSTRVNLSSADSSSSIRFSNDRPISTSRSISAVQRNQEVRMKNTDNGHNGHGHMPSSASKTVAKRTCMCSPTTHPGSFRCSLHKSFVNSQHVPYLSNRLNAKRSAMTNSLVRIETVEGGDLVKRALAALIRPSSHQQKRRSLFQPRRSRLSNMSKAIDVDLNFNS